MIYLYQVLKCGGIGDDRLRALIAILKVAHFLVKERTHPEASFSLEHLQYLVYAKQELMLNDELIDDLRTEVFLDLD